MKSSNHFLKYPEKYGIAFFIIAAFVVMANYYNENYYYTYEYYSTGEKMKKYHIEESLIEGKLFEYYKSGEYKSWENYKQGYKSDTNIYFDKEGKVIYKLYCEKGIVKDSIWTNWNNN